jgi:hypothetical protein
MKRFLCWLFGHGEIRNTTDEDGLLYPVCIRCNRFVETDISRAQKDYIHRRGGLDAPREPKFRKTYSKDAL